MGVSVLTLKFLNFIISLLPDTDFSNIPVLENVSDLTNIFAWVNFFIPTTVIVALLTITAGYYSFKAIYTILRDFVF